MESEQLEQIVKRLDVIIERLDGFKPMSAAEKVIGWVATGIGILSIISIIDIIRTWPGG